MAEKHIIKYPNGATFIYYQQNVNSSTDVTIGFLGGASLDEKKLGLAHALEHSFFFGTDKLSKEEIYEKFSQTGTNYNAYTSQDCIAAIFDCPSSSFEQILKIYSDMLINKNISEEEFEREKKVILQELYMTLDNEKYDILDYLADKNTYKKGSQILGNFNTLSNLTVKDLVEYKEKNFVTNNMVISVVSNLPYEKVKPLIEKYLIERFPTNMENTVKLKSIKYNFNNRQYLIDMQDKKSFALYFMFKGLKNAEKNELFSYFEDWYFNGFAGELLKNMRLQNPFVYTSNFGNIRLTNLNIKNFSILTSPENVNDCILEFTSILRNLIQNGISEKEFKLFQETMIAERERKTNIKNHNSTNLFSNYIYGEKPFVKGFYEKLMSITRDDINQYFRKVYGNGRLIVECIGDIYKAENRFFLEDYQGYNALTNEAFLNFVLEKKLQETPIYGINEILDQFSLKYKHNDYDTNGNLLDINVDFRNFHTHYFNKYLDYQSKLNKYLDNKSKLNNKASSSNKQENIKKDEEMTYRKSKS